MFHGPRLRLLAVKRDDAREDGGDLLRRVKLTGFLAGTGGELADKVFVGVAERIDVGGKLTQAVGDLLDDFAQLLVLLGMSPAELFRAKVDLREEPLEG